MLIDDQTHEVTHEVTPEVERSGPVTDEDIIAIIKPMRDRANDQARIIEDERAEGLKWYRAEPYGNERPNWAQTVHPTIFSAVEWLKPGLVEVFIGDFFSFSPVVKNPEAQEEAEASAERLQAYVRHKLFTECDGEQIVEDIVHDALTGQYAVAKVTQREEYDIVTEPLQPAPLAQVQAQFEQDQTIVKIVPGDVQMVQDPMTGAIADVVTGGTVYRKVPKYVGPYVEVVPPEELRFTPGYRRLDACPLVAHVVLRDLDYIRRQELSGVYREGVTELVKAKCKPGDDDDTSALARTERAYLDDQTNVDASGDYDAVPGLNLARSNAQYEVWECYVRLDLDGSGLLQPAIVTLCGDVVLKGPEKNPYGGPPFEIFSMFKEPHSMRGRGLPHILDNRQRVATNLLRMIQDGAANSAYRGWMTSDPKTQQALANFAPGDVVLVPGFTNGATQEITPSPPPGFILNAFELTLQEISKESGVNENMQGLDNNSLNKTASGMSMRLSAGMMRQKLYARRLARFFKKIIERIVDCVRLYPPEDDLPMLGADVVVQPGDVMGRYTVNIDVGVGPQDKQARAGALAQLVGLQLQAGPMLGIAPEKIIATIKAQYEALDIDTTAFLPTPEEIATIQQLAAQNQQLLADNQAMSAQLMVPQGMPPGGPMPGQMIPGQGM